MEDMQNVLLPVVPTLALGKLDRPMNYGSSAVPIVLTIRDRHRDTRQILPLGVFPLQLTQSNGAGGLPFLPRLIK